MEMYKYLNEYLNRGENISGTSIEVYYYKTPQDEVTVEYSPETDKADIIHTNRNRRIDYYEAANVQELKQTLEYCLGPLVSDVQWNQVATSKNALELEEELEDF